jgi:hypothetical protein
VIRLTISISDHRRPGRLATSGECATYLLDSTLQGPFRLKAEGNRVSDSERQRLGLRLHRACSSGVSYEGGKGEQDRNGPGMSHRNLRETE